MSWWEKDPGRWDREEQEMKMWFPISQWGERVERGRAIRFWEVIVEPVPSAPEVLLVLADLDRGGPVDMNPSGWIRHSQRCRADHKLREGFEGLEIPDTVFLLEAVYQEPPGHPLVRSLDPKVSCLRFPGHPHFYGGEVICPLFPPENTWRWKNHTMTDYLEHVAVWLLKHLVWKATQDRDGKGIWIGPDVEHSPMYLLWVIRPSDQCHCGSGKTYRRCCRSHDRARAA